MVDLKRRGRGGEGWFSKKVTFPKRINKTCIQEIYFIDAMCMRKFTSRSSNAVLFLTVSFIISLMRSWYFVILCTGLRR